MQTLRARLLQPVAVVGLFDFIGSISFCGGMDIDFLRWASKKSSPGRASFAFISFDWFTFSGGFFGDDDPFGAEGL